MEETLVSLEVAMLLKERGFDEECKESYNIAENYTFSHDPSNNSKYIVWSKNNYCTVCTQSTAQEWLRKKHGIYFNVLPTMYNNKYRFGFECTCIKWDEEQKRTFHFRYHINDSYEEALEEGLKGALSHIA